MWPSDAAIKNAELLRNCCDSERLDTLRYSINDPSRLCIEPEYALKNWLNHTNNQGVLTSLTRGQFQSFLLDSEISLYAKRSLLRAEESYWGSDKDNPLVEYDKEKVLSLYDDEDYGDILRRYDEIVNSDIAAAEKLSEAFSDVKDQLHLEDRAVIDGVDAEYYSSEFEMLKEVEMGSIYAILLEPNLAQRNKWLQEVTNLEDVDDISSYYATEMQEDSRRYIYYMLKEATARKFYRSIGIDYDEVCANEMVPERVDFGLEMEEIGVSYGFCEIDGFDSSNDITLCDYDRSSSKRLSTQIGEYQTDVLSTDYPKDYERLARQIDILNYYGARTNETCGLHIHVSTRYTEQYDISIDDEDCSLERANALQKEIFEMQRLIGKQFKLFEDREKETCCYLSTPDFDELQLDRYQFVNMASLDEGTGIEFRFGNLPFALDKKVIDAYCDFVTNYMLYIDEGNNTTDIFEEVIKEVDPEKRTRKSDDELKLEILKQELCLKPSTMQVLDHIDDIYEFHNVGELYTESGECLDYYEKYNKPIVSDKDSNEVVYEE